MGYDLDDLNDLLDGNAYYYKTHGNQPAADIFIRLLREVRGMTDAPAFLRLQKASNNLAWDCDAIGEEYAAYHQRIADGLSPTTEDYLNALTAIHVGVTDFQRRLTVSPEC